MDIVRDSWTDARLDDFAQNTDRRFDEVNRRFDTVERRMEAGFSEMRGRFDAIDGRFDAMNARFDAMQRTLLYLVGGFVVALIGLLATLIATQL